MKYEDTINHATLSVKTKVFKMDSYQQEREAQNDYLRRSRQSWCYLVLQVWWDFSVHFFGLEGKKIEKVQSGYDQEIPNLIWNTCD